MPALCLWRDCPASGPYADPKTLFEHINRTHTPEGQVGTTIFLQEYAKETTEGPTEARFACLWRGCGKRQTAGREQEQWLTHLRVHCAYQPYVCTVPGCEHASAGPRGLGTHMRIAHAMEAEIRCEWRDCTAPTPPDAPALLAHLLAEHRRGLVPGVRCGWRGCAHTFTPRSSLGHLEGHCPPLYKHKCPACGLEFKSKKGLKTHVAAKHPAEKDAESEGSSDRPTPAEPFEAAVTRKRALDADADRPVANRRCVNIVEDTQPRAGQGAVDTGNHCEEKVERTIEELIRAKMLAESRVRELEALLRAARREAADADDWEYCT